MDLVILASVLAFGGLFALTGLFDVGDSAGDNPDPDNPDPANPDDPPFVHGGAGDDSLEATFGTLSGWRGDDDLDLAGTAHGYGNQGDDRIFAGDSGQAHGGQVNDRLEVRAADNLDRRSGCGCDEFVPHIVIRIAKEGGACDRRQRLRCPGYIADRRSTASSDRQGYRTCAVVVGRWSTEEKEAASIVVPCPVTVGGNGFVNGLHVRCDRIECWKCVGAQGRLANSAKTKGNDRRKGHKA